MASELTGNHRRLHASVVILEGLLRGVFLSMLSSVEFHDDYREGLRV